MIIEEGCLYCESLFCIIGIYVAAVLSIKEHLKPQIILVDYTPLLHPIHLADVDEERYYSPFRTVPDYRALMWSLGQIGAKPSPKVRLTPYSRSSIKSLLSYLLNLSIMS
jgi:hypothetical protein